MSLSEHPPEDVHDSQSELPPRGRVFEAIESGTCDIRGFLWRIGLIAGAAAASVGTFYAHEGRAADAGKVGLPVSVIFACRAVMHYCAGRRNDAVLRSMREEGTLEAALRDVYACDPSLGGQLRDLAKEYGVTFNEDIPRA